jgi:hypothetical protein
VDLLGTGVLQVHTRASSYLPFYLFKIILFPKFMHYYAFNITVLKIYYEKNLFVVFLTTKNTLNKNNYVYKCIF